MERVDIAAVVEQGGDADGEESGVLDRLAALEEAMPRWTEVLTGITAEIEQIGSIVVRHPMTSLQESGREKDSRLGSR